MSVRSRKSHSLTARSSSSTATVPSMPAPSTSVAGKPAALSSVSASLIG